MHRRSLLHLWSTRSHVQHRRVLPVHRKGPRHQHEPAADPPCPCSGECRGELWATHGRPGAQGLTPTPASFLFLFPTSTDGLWAGGWVVRLGRSLQHLLLCRSSQGSRRHHQHPAPPLCRSPTDGGQGRVGEARLLPRCLLVAQGEEGGGGGGPRVHYHVYHLHSSLLA
jgi:hypothetical protein